MNTIERPSHIIKSDVSFDDPIYHEFTNTGYFNNTNGILKDQGSYYLYGDKVDFIGSNTYANILKIDSASLRITGNWDYKIGTQGNRCLSLQATPDNDLAFMLDYDGGAGPDAINGQQIIRIDTSGNILDSIDFKRLRYDAPRLLVDIEGAYYFSSKDHPILGWPYLSNGRINKLPANLDSLEWSLELPSEPNGIERQYEIKDYIQAQNGDIIAAGGVFHIDPDDNANFNGFITRVSLEGEIIWLKLYKLKQDAPNVNSSIYKEALLFQIQETSEGGFLALGGSEYHTPDFESVTELWLLSVNEDGCITGEECEEITIITATESPVSVNEFFPVYPNPVSNVLHLPAIPFSTCELWSPQGQLVFAGGNANSIDMSRFSSGLYLLKLLQKNQPSRIYKIIKQ